MGKLWAGFKEALTQDGEQYARRDGEGREEGGEEEEAPRGSPVDPRRQEEEEEGTIRDRKDTTDFPNPEVQAATAEARACQGLPAHGGRVREESGATQTHRGQRKGGAQQG